VVIKKKKIICDIETSSKDINMINKTIKKEDSDLPIELKLGNSIAVQKSKQMPKIMQANPGK
jgi:hypothetical protein